MAKQFLDATGLLYLWTKMKTVFQEKLVSGTNIKTIAGNSILGEGNINFSFLPLSGGKLTGLVQTTDEIQWKNTNPNTRVTSITNDGVDITKNNDSYYTHIRHDLTTIYAEGSDGYVYLGSFRTDIDKDLYNIGALGIRITNEGGGQGVAVSDTGITLYTSLGIKSANSTQITGKDNEMWNTAGGKTSIEALTENEINNILV